MWHSWKWNQSTKIVTVEHRLTCLSKREILLQTFLEAPCYPHTWRKPLSRTPANLSNVIIYMKNLSDIMIHINDTCGIALFTSPPLSQCWKECQRVQERFDEYSVLHLIVIDISQKYFLVSFLLFCCYLQIFHCTNLPDLRKLQITHKLPHFELDSFA